MARIQSTNTPPLSSGTCEPWSLELIGWRGAERSMRRRLWMGYLVVASVVLMSGLAVGLERMSFWAAAALVCVVGFVVGVLRGLRSRRAHCVWTWVDARALDKEVRCLASGRWGVRVLCEFLYAGKVWTVTPDMVSYTFPSEGAARAFLSEHIGDEHEMTVCINPSNPLQAQI